jgi:hypothetical protein
MNTWIHRNKALKFEIVSFLKSQSIFDIATSCKFISQTAYYCALSMKDYGYGLEDCEEYLLDDVISTYFDLNIRDRILNFINRKCVLEYEALNFMDQQRWWQYTEVSAYPKAELQVLPDKILIVALDRETINPPEGGNYCGHGTGRWEYHLSDLKRLVGTQIPVIKHPGVIEICI